MSRAPVILDDEIFARAFNRPPASHHAQTASQEHSVPSHAPHKTRPPIAAPMAAPAEPTELTIGSPTAIEPVAAAPALVLKDRAGAQLSNRRPTPPELDAIIEYLAPAAAVSPGTTSEYNGQTSDHYAVAVQNALTATAAQTALDAPRRSTPLPTPTPALNTSKWSAIRWTVAGFIVGIAFWHFVGFWDFMSKIVLDDQAPARSAASTGLRPTARPHSQAPIKFGVKTVAPLKRETKITRPPAKTFSPPQRVNISAQQAASPPVSRLKPRAPATWSTTVEQPANR